MSHENTGGPVSYYRVDIKHPATAKSEYTAECIDVIEALNMTFEEGDAFKAIWRKAAARTLGKQKDGDTPLRNAEKVAYYGQRMVVCEQAALKKHFWETPLKHTAFVHVDSFNLTDNKGNVLAPVSTLKE